MTDRNNQYENQILEDSREIILMQPGPFHLFMTTGIFYVWQLKDDFDFILVVSEDYKLSEKFQKLIELPFIKKVEYLSSEQSLLKRHRNHVDLHHQILIDFQPTYILLHGTVHIESLYLIWLAKKLYPNTKFLQFQTARLSIDWDANFRLLRSAEIEERSTSLPSFLRSTKAIGLFVDIRNYLWYIVNYKIIPFFTTGGVFKPWMNVQTGKIYPDAFDDIDLLCYMDCEADIYRKLGKPKINIIQHPMQTCSKDVITFLNGETVELDQILIVPSYGFTSALRENGLTTAQIVDHVSNHWKAALENLSSNFPNYTTIMKLHPRSSEDPIWKEITSRLIGYFPNIKIMNSNVSAEWLVYQSKIIVGDVTTVLWWAALYGSKTVISLDTFNFPGGDEMRHYKSYIYYIKDIKEKFLLTPKSTDDAKADISEFIF
ncbi:polysialyltransferase family glycosyltransferase [Lentilitoribacter sp. Alg239-R112]|uniref:polysialyltransferase family glycosyltransferase n=1 Tax=Lentilitoribacter sp. Alg239-R112 TaxID=2305987 RepID=UPI0013A6EC8D|nr:polysialyltransferase family glycosyltransferase [Lentilitoribacter sp. Alg239-R112]